MKAGFSLLELLLGVALIILLATMAVPIYGNLQPRSLLLDESARAIDAYRRAHYRAMSGLGNTDHGVRLFVVANGADRLVIYRGSSYSNRENSYDEVLNFDGGIVVGETLSNLDVTFAQGSGIPDSTGIITLTHATSGQKSITINSWGLVDGNL